jgi:hypothetical protein
MVVFTQRLQQNPDDADLRCQIAQIFLRCGEEEVLRRLRLNLQSHPNHDRSHVALADYYHRQVRPALGAEHRRLAGAAQRAFPGATTRRARPASAPAGRACLGST